MCDTFWEQFQRFLEVPLALFLLPEHSKQLKLHLIGQEKLEAYYAYLKKNM